jgi:hypothetical protein
MTGGVLGKGRQRIQYDFRLNGVRYRPTLKAIPTEANLRRAREHLKAIKERIRCGTFSFMEEFPDFRDWQKLVPHSSYRTCNQVFDQYLAHCESRLAKNDLSFATVTGYRKALDSVWRSQWAPSPSSRSNTQCCYVSPFRIRGGTRKRTTTRSVRYAVPSSSATAIILNISIRPRP